MNKQSIVGECIVDTAVDLYLHPAEEDLLITESYFRDSQMRIQGYSPYGRFIFRESPVSITNNYFEARRTRSALTFQYEAPSRIRRVRRTLARLFTIQH
jgi:hypothetical protein